MMTRSIVMLAFLLLTLPPDRALAQDHAARAPHIRSSVPELLDALANGLQQSPTLHDLVNRLDASDVVVYLVFDRSPLPPSAGHISLMAAVEGCRYLRLSVNPRYTGWPRIAILGHELQHAVEIAKARSAIDQASVATLYRQIGFRTLDDRGFDSLAAIAAGHQVRRELLERRRARPLSSGER
jgi:hypothetical protein